MKKRTGVLISLINYHCLKQARKRRGEAGRGVGRGLEGWGGTGRGGEGRGGVGRDGEGWGGFRYTTKE